MRQLNQARCLAYEGKLPGAPEACKTLGLVPHYYSVLIREIRLKRSMAQLSQTIPGWPVPGLLPADIRIECLATRKLLGFEFLAFPARRAQPPVWRYSPNLTDG